MQCAGRTGAECFPVGSMTASVAGSCSRIAADRSARTRGHVAAGEEEAFGREPMHVIYDSRDPGAGRAVASPRHRHLTPAPDRSSNTRPPQVAVYS